MPRKKPHYLSAIGSVALVLFMLGFFALLALHARQLTSLFKERVDLWLELRQDLPEEDVERLMDYVRSQSFVLPETVAFVSREEAAAIMQKDLGEESLLEQLPGMMRDVVRFNVQAAYFQEDSLRAWRETIRQDSLVEDLFVEVANVGNVGQNIEKLGWIALGLGLLLIFAAVALIHNTIRLDLYTNRFLIKNQELVGASWGYISWPYLQRGIFNGLWSALLAIAALAGLLWLAQQNIPELKSLEDQSSMALVFAGLVVLGVLISYVSTWFVIHKFLRMRVDDLY
ncbi:MAG: cell division protein FtsX [Saprospiraceae bacterium]